MLARPCIYLRHCQLVKCECCKDIHWQHAAVSVASPNLFLPVRDALLNHKILTYMF